MNTTRLCACLGGAALAVLTLTGCATVGETGRYQLMAVSREQESQLGLTSFEKLKQETPVSKDPAANALLQKVGRRIAAAVSTNMPNAQWEFVVFDSKEANAFCLPGGKIGVYTGILPITKNEAGLATVIGHEVAHATCRHGAERMSEAMGMDLLGQFLNSSLSSQNPKVQEGAMVAFGLGTQVGRTLPHSRGVESEADRVGLRYMARAGYDPEEAVKFWQRFSDYNKQAGGSSSPLLGFLRTHPLDETRIKQLQDWMPEAKAQYRPAK
jgi:metalloendopeptidase OMA1, mitochondrial